MPINIIDNFNVNVSKAIDSRMVVANLAARNAISYKYDGLKVFQQDDRKTYTWNSGSSTWSIENDNLGDGYVPKFSAVGFTNSAIYSTASRIGINTNDPKEVFQISKAQLLDISEPLTVNMQYSEPIIAYNWYYSSPNGQTFDINKGSTKLAFGDDNFTFYLRTPGDPSANAGSFVIPLYMNIDGNVGIGSDALTTINASSLLFTNQIPKMEITTGGSTGAYSEFITLRHPVVDLSAAPRSLGYLLKMSDESNLGESSKMGGMMLESTSSSSNNPSLYLLTNDEKRLKIDSGGNVSTQAGKYLSILGKLYINSSSLYPVTRESFSTSFGGLYGQAGNLSGLLGSIPVPSYSTVQVELTFTGRIISVFGSIVVNQSNRVIYLFSVDGGGVISLVSGGPSSNPNTVFSNSDNAYFSDYINDGYLDYSIPNVITPVQDYSVSSGWSVCSMVDYEYRILY